ncbi:hypothetical protein EWM64_g2246 [Hericium alpestre]|uniref:CDP-diacylglycerol--serine O-phosphatidyltransferase n=1 Tax=Hericium alpestre TaxID=135208 RepID=A0A4Z0A410_9AGAM|nr:hypothetical protein EWM64_g2246 [Hericium alpestre]
MREYLPHEERIMPFGYGSVDDNDDEYDVYLFWPSLRTQEPSAPDSVFQLYGPVLSSFAVEDITTDLETLASCSTASETSLDSRALEETQSPVLPGYSKMFTMGFILSMSQRKTVKENGQNAQDAMDDLRAVALQQYKDTDGHFSLVRNFRLADLVTIMNGVCGSFSLFSSCRYLLTNDESYLTFALALPYAGLFFDFLDGKVARWRKSSSMLGQELDSLADLVSFGVAPAVLAFVVGFRTCLDTVVLTGFICCGLARLARFNATVAVVPKDATGKARYFEGLPIPSSLAMVAALFYWKTQGWIEGKKGIPGGVVSLWQSKSGDGDIHIASFVIGVWAAAMVSKTLRVRKL